MVITDKTYEECFSALEEAMRRLICGFNSPMFDQLVGKLEKQKGNFYTVYPFLFSSHFPKVTKYQLDALTLAGNLYFLYLLLFDELFDGDTPKTSLVPLHVIHEAALQQLYKLFPGGSPFWKLFDGYQRELFSAILREHDGQRYSLSSVGSCEKAEDELLAVARGKSAVAKSATAALWVLTGCEGSCVPFTDTQDHFHIGLQLLDDLEDWKEDFGNHRSSYLLSTVFADEGLAEALNKADVSQIQALGRYIYFSGASQTLLNLAVESFEKAINSCEPYDIPSWKSLVETYHKKTVRLRDGMQETRGWVLRKRDRVQAIHEHVQQLADGITGKLGRNRVLSTTIGSALAYLLVEQENDYPEMSHRMALPTFGPSSGDVPEVDVDANLFQRTLVLEALLDANEFHPQLVPHDIVSSELIGIVKAKVSCVRGGWSYFPTYQWLPPDTDDLAQVIRILTRTKYDNRQVLLDDSIDLLVRSNCFPSGAFRTWILDPNDKSERQRQVGESVASRWGEYRGKDIEVTANVLHALWLYDRCKYESVIMQGIEAVAATQTTSGVWQSVWYWSVYYGTFAAIRLLTATGQKREKLGQTLSYLLSNQQADGGWGERQSDPLATSLVLLTLFHLADVGLEVEFKVLDRGMHYLVDQQHGNGSWSQVPFIKMFVGNKNITYRSRTITTSFALRALVRLDSRLRAVPMAENSAEDTAI